MNLAISYGLHRANPVHEMDIAKQISKE